MLNDSSVVGGASWAGLAARATHRDTPYLLLYRREGGPSPGEEPRPHRALLDSLKSDLCLVFLCSELTSSPHQLGFKMISFAYIIRDIIEIYYQDDIFRDII